MHIKIKRHSIGKSGRTDNEFRCSQCVPGKSESTKKKKTNTKKNYFFIFNNIMKNMKENRI